MECDFVVIYARKRTGVYRLPLIDSEEPTLSDGPSFKFLVCGFISDTLARLRIIL